MLFENFLKKFCDYLYKNIDISEKEKKLKFGMEIVFSAFFSIFFTILISVFWGTCNSVITL